MEKWDERSAERFNMSDLELVGGVDPAGREQEGLPIFVSRSPQGKPDVVVDFDAPAVQGLETCSRNIPMVIGTTGFKPHELQEWQTGSFRKAGHHCPNFAIGAVLMMRFARSGWFLRTG